MNPTLLSQLAHSRTDDLLRAARSQTPRPVMPRLLAPARALAHRTQR